MDATQNQPLLLVEDNEVNREMLVRRLRRAGYDVSSAADGKAALDSVASEQPALVLLDMNLPIKDGWTVAREIRSELGLTDLPIIALTAHAMATDRDKALAAGCDDYATKPIDFPELLKKIERFLSR